jgi:hypothetical protein
MARRARGARARKRVRRRRCKRCVAGGCTRRPARGQCARAHALGLRLRTHACANAQPCSSSGVHGARVVRTSGCAAELRAGRAWSSRRRSPSSWAWTSKFGQKRFCTSSAPACPGQACAGSPASARCPRTRLRGGSASV